MPECRQPRTVLTNGGANEEFNCRRRSLRIPFGATHARSRDTVCPRCPSGKMVPIGLSAGTEEPWRSSTEAAFRSWFEMEGGRRPASREPRNIDELEKARCRTAYSGLA